MKNPRIIEGKVEINPYGNWSDVDRGVYIGGERVAAEGGFSLWNDYEGKRVRLTIEVLPDLKEDTKVRLAAPLSVIDMEEDERCQWFKVANNKVCALQTVADRASVSIELVIEVASYLYNEGYLEIEQD